MPPFFSIIIPTYNRALLIKRAIKSVLQQTVSDWELIIVDDGSTDNTKEVIESYSDERIHYIYQLNAERSAARNNGIKNAKGQYICFLDSDDYYLPERLELLFNEIRSRNFPISAFYTGLVFDRDDVLTNHEEKIRNTNIFDHIALSVIHSQQMCIPQNILKGCDYDTHFHIGEDMELWLRIADKFSFIYLANQNTVAVVDHDNRSVNIKRYNSSVYQMQMFNRIFSSGHPGNRISKSIKQKLISNCYFGMAKYFIYTGAKWAAIKNLCLSITTDISNKQNKYRINLIIHLLFLNDKVEQML